MAPEECCSETAAAATTATGLHLVDFVFT